MIRDVGGDSWDVKEAGFRKNWGEEGQTQWPESRPRTGKVSSGIGNLSDAFVNFFGLFFPLKKLTHLFAASGLNCGMQNLFPWPGIKLQIPWIGSEQESQPLTTRELLEVMFLRWGLNWMVWSEVRWQWVKKRRPQLLGLFGCLTWEKVKGCQGDFPQKVNLDVFIGWVGKWTNRTYKKVNL